MRLLAVNVGQPRPVTYRGRSYRTAIYKDPVAGSVHVGRLNVAGDAQGNLESHGGPDMAVYVYGREHYPHWEAELKCGPLPPGAFGENLTVEGMAEADIAIGDIFRIATARFQVTEPRTPCHKLAMKFDDPGLPRRFAESGRVGFYFRVLTEGEIGAGDEITLEAADPARLTVAEVLALWADKGASAEALSRALAVEALSASWRRRFLARRERASQGRPELREWREDRLTWI